MKNIHQKILTLSIISFLLFAQLNCSKDSPIPANTPFASCNLISEQQGNIDTLQFLYFPDGKLSSYIAIDTFTYNYVNPNFVFIISSGGIVDTLFLNNGLVFKVGVSDHTYYYYDPNGYPVRKVSASGTATSITDYKWINGNLTTIHSYTINPAGSWDNGTTTMTYNNIVNKTNYCVNGIGIGAEFYGVWTGLFGKKSTNFPVSSSNGGTTSYTFDGNGVLTQCRLRVNTGIVYSRTFKFSCK